MSASSWDWMKIGMKVGMGEGGGAGGAGGGRQRRGDEQDLAPSTKDS